MPASPLGAGLTRSLHRVFQKQSFVLSHLLCRGPGIKGLKYLFCGATQNAGVHVALPSCCSPKDFFESDVAEMVQYNRVLWIGSSSLRWTRILSKLDLRALGSCKSTRYRRHHAAGEDLPTRVPPLQRRRLRLFCKTPLMCTWKRFKGSADLWGPCRVWIPLCKLPAEASRAPQLAALTRCRRHWK